MKKNSNGYIPRPEVFNFDKLPCELQDLIGQIAGNIHEVWASKKMEEDWTFGETLDWNAKKHPSLKPYAELDESQKDYDRNTALATISFLMNKGFIITK